MHHTSLKMPSPSSLSKEDLSAEYALERICRHEYEPFQLNFARHALQLFPEEERYAFEANHQGLVLRVHSETELERAVEILREYFGDHITIWHSATRHGKDEPIEAPVPEGGRH